MSHWDQYQRLYTGALVFVSVNAGAAVAVFTSIPIEHLIVMGRRELVLDIVKCIALASGSLLSYLQVSKPANPPSP